MTMQIETGRVTRMRMLERKVRMRAQHPGVSVAAETIVINKLGLNWAKLSLI